MATLARGVSAVVGSLQATRRAWLPSASCFQLPFSNRPPAVQVQLSRCYSTQRMLPTAWQQASALVRRPLQGRSHTASFHTTAVCHKQVFVGTVVSDKPMKTVVVSVLKISTHPFYKVMMKKRRKYMAHDELDTFKVGDKVVIEQWRPLSKRKFWMVTGYADREKEKQIGPSRDAKIAEINAAKQAARAERWKQQAEEAVAALAERKKKKKERRVRARMMAEQAAEEDARRRAQKIAQDNE